MGKPVQALDLQMLNKKGDNRLMHILKENGDALLALAYALAFKETGWGIFGLGLHRHNKWAMHIQTQKKMGETYRIEASSVSTTHKLKENGQTFTDSAYGHTIKENGLDSERTL